jgi:hypothetical protein
MSNASRTTRTKATDIFIPSIPAEIWRAIFIISVTINDPVSPSWYVHVDPGLYSSTRPTSSAHTSLRLSHVCAAWRSILLEFGRPWCDVDLSTLRFAELCLERSRPQHPRLLQGYPTVRTDRYTRTELHLSARACL